MEINKVSAIQNQNYTSNVKNEQKAQKTPEQIKDGKKKLALALAATAAIAAAGIAIIKGKANKVATVASENKLSKVEELVNAFKERLEKSGLSVSKERADQLQQLSEEQLTAMSDGFVSRLIARGSHIGAMTEEALNLLKSMTPDELTKLQNDAAASGFFDHYLTFGRYHVASKDAIVKEISRVIGR